MTPGRFILKSGVKPFNFQNQFECLHNVIIKDFQGENYHSCIVLKQTFDKQDVIIPAGNIQIGKNGNGMCVYRINALRMGPYAYANIIFSNKLAQFSKLDSIFSLDFR